MNLDSGFPMKLENLLEVPLRIIKLDDLLQEKMRRRKCRSASPLLSCSKKSLRNTSDKLYFEFDDVAGKEDQILKGRRRSLSVSCLSSYNSNNCCLKPPSSKLFKPLSFYNETQTATFKTRTFHLADGTSPIIPVMDLSREDKDECKDKLDKSPVEYDVDFRKEKNISSSYQKKTASPVVLDKVLENPKRFEDLIQEERITICGNSANNNHNKVYMEEDENHNDHHDDNRITSVNMKMNINRTKDTLKLTLYNDGRKESVKEFSIPTPTGLEQQQQLYHRRGVENMMINNREMEKHHLNQKYFVNPEGLQMARISRWEEASGLETHPDHDIQRREDNRMILSSSLKAQGHLQKPTWEQCDGLQISRCHIVQNANRNSPPISIPGKSDTEKLIEKHLQSYLTSMKYVKRSQSFPPNQEEISSNNCLNLTQGPEKFHNVYNNADLWPERKIARVPTRPYLRRNVTFELPKSTSVAQSPSTCVPTPTPSPKRFRPSPTSTVTSALGQEQHVDQTRLGRYPNGGNQSTIRGQGQLHHLHQVPYMPMSTRAPYPSPNHSPRLSYPPNQQENLRYGYNPSSPNHTPRAGAPATSSLMHEQVGDVDGGNNNLYYERLRRYWEIYKRQDVDVEKLTEYYEKYHFYPWEILTARDEAVLRELRIRQEQEIESQLVQGGVEAPYKQGIMSSAGSITRGLPNPSFTQRTPVQVPEQNPRNLIRFPNNNGNISQHPRAQQYHAMQMQLFQQNQQRLQSEQQQRNYNLAQRKAPVQSHAYQTHHSGPVPENSLHLTALQQCDLQNAPNYKTAYDQLAAAAVAVASVASPNQNQEPSKSILIYNHERNNMIERAYQSQAQSQEIQQRQYNGDFTKNVYNGGRNMTPARQVFSLPSAEGKDRFNSPVYSQMQSQPTPLVRRHQGQIQYQTPSPTQLSHVYSIQEQQKHYANEHFTRPPPDVDERRLGTRSSSLETEKVQGMNLKRHHLTNSGSREKTEERYQVLRATSPVPLIVGREEIVAPSASIITATENVIDEEATLDSQEVIEMEERGEKGGNTDTCAGSCGAWQHDHVVMLDKRTRVFMCKRCFETFREDEEGLNMRKHLYCKLPSNQVECQVCLQLIQKENFQRHMETHETYSSTTKDLHVIRVLPNTRYKDEGS